MARVPSCSSHNPRAAAKTTRSETETTTATSAPRVPDRRRLRSADADVR